LVFIPTPQAIGTWLRRLGIDNQGIKALRKANKTLLKATLNNCKNITPGDDYAAMNQAVFRRYSRLLKDKKTLPDVVFIDGGLGPFALCHANELNRFNTNGVHHHNRLIELSQTTINKHHIR
jgi:excinuclease UvrABC nuclease subunit